MARMTVFLASDLHFATKHDEGLLDGLVTDLRARGAKGDACVLVVPGDFTQKAKSDDYRAASAWLRTVLETGAAVVTTPGNHDFGGLKGALPGLKRGARKRYREHVRNPVRSAGDGRQGWFSRFGSGTGKYDSITVVGGEAFVALRSIHKARHGWRWGHRPPYRIRKEQLVWAKETLESLRAERPIQGIHLITHIPIWKRSSGFPGVNQFSIVQARRRRLEDRLLLPLGVDTFIHGHDHMFHPPAAVLPKSRAEIYRIGVPTLSARNRRGHPSGYLRWTPGEAPVAVTTQHPYGIPIVELLASL